MLLFTETLPPIKFGVLEVTKNSGTATKGHGTHVTSNGSHASSTRMHMASHMCSQVSREAVPQGVWSVVQ